MNWIREIDPNYSPFEYWRDGYVYTCESCGHRTSKKKDKILLELWQQNGIND